MFAEAAISLFYEYICVIFFCAIFQIFMVRKEHKKGYKYGIKHFIWVYIFFIYLMLVFECTGSGSIYDISSNIKLNVPINKLIQVNLIPFDSASGGFMTHAANSIMFMPLGFLLPLIWNKFESPAKTIFAGLLFSLAIELSQLLNLRLTDIDDLIMNTLGTFLGWMIFYLFEKLRNKKGKEVHNLETEKMSFLACHEACFYLILSFAGEFFLYDSYLIM